MSKIKDMFRDLVGANNREQREEVTRQILSGEVLISDCHASYEFGGGAVLISMADEDRDRSAVGNPRQHWLKVLCDKFGDPVKPGDVVTESWEKRKMRPDGFLVTNDEIESDKINGEYNRKWVTDTSFTVDEAGCIRVPFALAAQYVACFGVHWVTGYRLCRTLNRESHDPVPDGKGGMRRVINWRYAEIPDAEHERLIHEAQNAVKPVVVDVPAFDESDEQTEKPKSAKKLRRVRKVKANAELDTES